MQVDPHVRGHKISIRVDAVLGVLQREIGRLTRQVGNPYHRLYTSRRMRSSHGSLLLEHGTSENRSAAQRGVEAVERHRGHQQNSSQTDARIPCRPLGRQGKVIQERAEDECTQKPQQAEAS
jgi:hypothetical protein